MQAKPEREKAFSNGEKTEAHNNSTYAAMISSMDDGIGRIMAELEALGLSGNTLLLFTSDNGGVWKTSKQWPLRAGKGSYYEGGIREPMVVRWPGRIKAGTVCDIPVSGIDFFPTFLETAEVKTPGGKILDGVSLMPLLTRSGNIPDRPLFWHFPIYLEAYFNDGPFETRDNKFRTRPGSAVRFGKWKLLEYFEDGGLELYNLDEDIGEKHNLAKTSPGKAKELLAMLQSWRSELKAPIPSKLNPEYRPS